MTMSPTSSPDIPGFTWSPLVISLVGSICAFFLFLSYYSIIRRQYSLFHGPPSRDRSLTRLLNGNNPADDTSLHFHSRALDLAIVHSLPTIQFRRSNKESGQNGTDCAVCLGEFEEGDWLRLLPNCAHIFHIFCIDTWFQTHSTCPLCRLDVLHDFNCRHVCSLSTLTFMDRRDVYRETPYSYNVLGSEIMQNSMVWCRPTYSDQFGSEPEESDSTVSSPEVANDHQNTDCLHKQDNNLREGTSSRD